MDADRDYSTHIHLRWNAQSKTRQRIRWRVRKVLLAGLVINDMEAATGRPRRNIAAAEADVSVRGELRVVHQARLIVVGINRVGLEVARANRVVRRKREGDDLIDADARAGQAAIQASEEPCRVRFIRRTENGGLLHGGAQFATADEFKSIVKAAAEFSFRTGATGGEQRGQSRRGDEGESVTHKVCLISNA